MPKRFLLLCLILAPACGDDTLGPGSNDMSVQADMAPHAPSNDLASTDMETSRPSDDAGMKAFKFGPVITIVMENHDYNEIVGNTTYAPYINSLIKQYGLATNYYDIGHPSLPNYAYMVNGKHKAHDQNQPDAIYDTLTSDDEVASYLYYKKFANGRMLDEDNLGNQLQVAGIPWRGYFESMFAPCQLEDSGNRTYAARHNPFIYFNDILFAPNQLCQKVDVDYASNFAGDLASGNYKYMWISPDCKNDGHGTTGDPAHDGTPMDELKDSDNWAATNVQAILDSDAFKKSGVIFLTWDEAEGRTGPDGKQDDPDKIPMIIISPKIKSPGYTSNKRYTHANYLATIEDMFGLPRLNDAVGADNMMEFFQ